LEFVPWKPCYIRIWKNMSPNLGYNTGISILYMFFVCVLEKWYLKSLPIIIYFLCNSILAYINILIFQDGWNLGYLSLINIVGFVIFILLEKYSFKLIPIKSDRY